MSFKKESRTQRGLREKAKSIFQDVKELAAELARNWSMHNGSSMAAAMAYRSLFAVIPLVMFLVMVAELLQSNQWLKQAVRQVSDMEAASIPIEALKEVFGGSEVLRVRGSMDPLGMMFILLIMIYGVSTVFRELIIAIDTIWEENKKTGIRVALRRRLLGIVAVLLVGGVLAGALLISALSALWVQAWGNELQLAWILDRGIDFLVIPAALGLLFSLLYLYLPPVKLARGDVVWPTIVSTILFMLGQAVVRWYLQTANLVIYSGAVGGFVIFMLWVYFSAMTVLWGAEMTRLYAERWGSQRGRSKTHWWRRFSSSKK